MEKKKTYVVVCKQGNIRQECPLYVQKGIVCVECPYGAYIERVRPEDNSEQPHKENHD